MIGRLDEFLRDFLFGLAEQDARQFLAFRLRLPAHRVLQRRRHADVADLDREHRHAPFRGLASDLLAQLLVALLAIGQQRRQQRGADHLAKRGLRHLGDGLAVVGNLERGALGIVDLPEHHGVDIHRHRVLAQRGFGVDFGGLDALVEPGSHGVDERHDGEQARAANGGELAEPEHDGALPLIRDHDGLRNQDAMIARPTAIQ